MGVEGGEEDTRCLVFTSPAQVEDIDMDDVDLLQFQFEEEDEEEEEDRGMSLSSASSTPIPVSYELPRSKSGGLHRCKTAPAMDMAAVLRELQSQAAKDHHDQQVKEEEEEEEGDWGIKSWKPKSMVKQAGVLLILYLSMGVLVYGLNRDKFSGVETHPLVDALYFCIVTMCTIGYGDITPTSPSTKLFSCLFVLVGFGFIDILLTGVLSYLLDLQEKAILADIRHSHHVRRYPPFTPLPNNLLLVDLHKDRMRIRLKVAFALLVVFLCIAVGTLFLFFLEDLSFVDSLYLSALSVTTVGYGDRAFSTLSGRLFASLWLLVSTLAVARSFLYLVEARIDKRQRTLAKWVLQRDITPQDLFAANINNNNFITKSEYVIYKLKEMGKIGEHDVSLICNQFNKLDPNNMGRITLPDLLQNHH